MSDFIQFKPENDGLKSDSRLFYKKDFAIISLF